MWCDESNLFVTRRPHSNSSTSHFYPITGCPHAKDPNSPRSGTGGPPPNTKFTGCDNKTYSRNSEGGIPDEIGQPQHRITNAVGTLSMANTGTFGIGLVYLIRLCRIFFAHTLCVCVSSARVPDKYPCSVSRILNEPYRPAWIRRLPILHQCGQQQVLGLVRQVDGKCSSCLWKGAYFVAEYMDRSVYSQYLWFLCFGILTFGQNDITFYCTIAIKGRGRLRSCQANLRGSQSQRQP